MGRIQKIDAVAKSASTSQYGNIVEAEDFGMELEQAQSDGSCGTDFGMCVDQAQGLQGQRFILFI